MMKFLQWLAVGLFALFPLAGCGKSEPPAPPPEVQEAETTDAPPEVELGEPAETE